MYAAVAFAAWYGGYGPGLLVTALGYLAAHYVLSDSPGSPAGRGELEALPDLIVYAAGCLLLTGLGAGLRNALERAAERQTRLEQEAMERQRAEQRFQAFMDHTPAGAWIMDEAGRYVFMNRAYEAGLNLKRREDWLGKTVFDLHPAELARQIHTNDLIVLESGAAHQFVEEGVVDGQKYAVLSHKFPMYGPDRERYVAGTAMDITERRRAEEKLRDADRRKDEFLAILAHELRNPLHPIRTLAAVLRAATPSAPQLQTASDIIDRQVRQMTRLLDDLLDVSRITLNKLVLRWDTLELASIIESALEAARPLIAAAHHKVTVTLPNLPVHVAGDETRLAQVFSNLLGNAAKYTPNGGRLAVAVEVQEGYVSVAVRDGGIGIAPDFLPHVFEMFSQADSPLERSAGGLGIGLALVRGLTELHGGTVEARSDGRGCGSEFIVRLPVTQAPRAQPGHTALSRREGGCRYRVLVVDDNTDGADSMKLLLESLDNEVRVAYDGIAAMEAAESFSPDVVLLDIGLPKLNGYEVARWIERKAGAGPCSLQRVGAARGQSAGPRRGFDRHLTKPIDQN
jgi:PAS domain S-box-containing protein